jgi:predicted transcriptional regulator
MRQAPTIFDKLASIGCQFSNVTLTSVDIEQALAEAIETLPYSKDTGRILKVLCSWIIENGSQVILEKLVKILAQKESEGADVSYAALLGAFAVTQKIHKWAILKKFKPAAIKEVGDRKGVKELEEWAREVNFSIQKRAIQPDSKYTLSRAQIAQMHRQFRNRLVYGAQYRADIITAIQLGVTAVKDIVTLVGVSREPASRILKDLKDAGFLKEKGPPKKSRSYLDLS